MSKRGRPPIVVHCPCGYVGANGVKGQCRKCYYRDEAMKRYYARKTKCGLCLHCGKRPVSKPRGLCWTCYYGPGVRDQYAAWTPPGDADWRDCPGCGGKIATADESQSRCSTCDRPVLARPGYFHRIKQYAAAVAAGLPIPYEERT